MKKLLILVLFIFSSSLVFAQARVNEELPVISNIRELMNFDCWHKDSAGQWKSDSLFMYYGSHSSVSLRKLVLYSIKYKNAGYYLFSIVTNKVPLSRNDRNYQITNYYVIGEEDFNVKISKNSKYDNNIKIITHFESALVNTAEYDASIEDISYLFGSLINNSEVFNSDGNKRHITVNDEGIFLQLFTFYYIDDNVIRFYFGDALYKTMPDDQYFECSFEYFDNFFYPVIEE